MMKTIITMFITFALFLIAPSSLVKADESEKISGQNILELKEEIKGVKKELSDLKRDIKGLKSLIETRLPLRPSQPARPPRAATGKTSIEGDPFMGRKDASIVLVEFSDFQCPFCGRFFRNTLPQIKKNYVETEKIKYVFKDFPLAFHKEAQKAAEASHCAGEEGKYWEMHDLIFQNQQKMKVPNLVEHAEKLGLDKKSFMECLDDSRYAEGIKKDIRSGKTSGVTGTPSFLLGKINDNGEVEGAVIRGAKPYNAFRTAIDAMLKK